MWSIVNGSRDMSGSRDMVVLFHDGTQGDNGMAPSNEVQIAMGHGMMITEVNMAIGAIDRILKRMKDGKSNNRELTNANDRFRRLPEPSGQR